MVKTKYIKELINKIVDDECVKRGLDREKLNLFSITTVEYYINKFKNRKFKLNGTVYSGSPFNCGGFFSRKGNNLVVFINNGFKVKRMVDLIFVTYHELEHYADKITDNNLSNTIVFGMYMDQWISHFDDEYYKLNYDQNMDEIMANKLGIMDTRNYIYNNQIDGIDKLRDIEYLDCKALLYQFDDDTYNYYQTFEKYLKLYREHKDEINLPKFFQKFLNEDGTFKTISEIVNNNLYLEDPIYIVLASDTFRNEVDLSSLSNNDLIAIQEADLRRQKCEDEIRFYYEKLLEYNPVFKNSDVKNIYESMKNQRISRYEEIYLNSNQAGRRR